jgi:hypothetical protein
MRKRNQVEYAIVHVSDWNYEDKYYEAPIEFIKELKKRMKKVKSVKSMDDAWGWWVGNVDYGESKSTRDNPIKFGKVDMRLEEFFFDYNNPVESVDEWEFT